MGSIRDVLLGGKQQFYYDTFRKADQPLRLAQGNNVFIGESPRYIIETLGIVLIAALAYALSLQVGGIISALPLLGALALGAQRLLPALQQIYKSWASIIGSHVSLADTMALLNQPLSTELLQPAPQPLSLKKVISFENIRFRYNSNSPWVLDGLNLTISKGTRVGFVGSTGSGKSSALDLLMGLLMPTEVRFL